MAKKNKLKIGVLRELIAKHGGDVPLYLALQREANKKGGWPPWTFDQSLALYIWVGAFEDRGLSRVAAGRMMGLSKDQMFRRYKEACERIAKLKQNKKTPLRASTLDEIVEKYLAEYPHITQLANDALKQHDQRVADRRPRKRLDPRR
jgi:hypothetical protein